MISAVPGTTEPRLSTEGGATVPADISITGSTDEDEDEDAPDPLAEAVNGTAESAPGAAPGSHVTGVGATGSDRRCTAAARRALSIALPAGRRTALVCTRESGELCSTATA
ncbi:hypothetical protein [Streptomyces sp. NPDC002851]